MTLRYSLLSIALTAFIAACGGTRSTVNVPTTQPPKRQFVTANRAKSDDNPNRGTIKIAADVRKACGLADIDAHFAFDSAHVRSQDRKVLRLLADCFGSGPLKGRQMTLVGHADPRGADDYNLALGGRRADNVKQIIVAESMPDTRISTTSRGAMDASGTDEISWAADRYVDVTLGE